MQHYRIPSVICITKQNGQRRQEFTREDDLLGDTRDSRWAFILLFRMCRHCIRLMRMLGHLWRPYPPPPPNTLQNFFIRFTGSLIIGDVGLFSWQDGTGLRGMVGRHANIVS